jgi:hypothetical protein
LEVSIGKPYREGLGLREVSGTTVAASGVARPVAGVPPVREVLLDDGGVFSTVAKEPREVAAEPNE